MNEPLSLLTAFFLGFMGSTHCLGMCGGIISLLSMNNPNHTGLRNQLAYQFGRITTYSLLGLLVGGLGLMASDTHQQAVLILRTLSATLLILMGVYLMGLTGALVWLERFGGQLWLHLQPLSKHIIPITNLKRATVLGLLWGFLPCGLIYTTLAWAATSASPTQGAAVMMCFGLGNLPALLSAGLFAKQVAAFRQHLLVKYGFGLSIVALGIWTLMTIW